MSVITTLTPAIYIDPDREIVERIALTGGDAYASIVDMLGVDATDVEIRYRETGVNAFELGGDLCAMTEVVSTEYDFGPTWTDVETGRVFTGRAVIIMCDEKGVFSGLPIGPQTDAIINRIQLNDSIGAQRAANNVRLREWP